MLSALVLALGQLADGRVLRLLAKCIAITLALFVALGWIGWLGIDAALSWAGFGDANIKGGDDMRALTALVVTILGGWLLWRILAFAVLQFFADEVVEAVEARHYPSALARVRPLGWRRELAVGLKGAARAVLFNVAALPPALVLIITGIGPALLFLAVNAVLLGRELTEMVWLRHAHDPAAPLPLGWWERLALGGMAAGLLVVPFANLLAPFLGAAAATHLVHRKGEIAHAS